MHFEQGPEFFASGMLVVSWLERSLQDLYLAFQVPKTLVLPTLLSMDLFRLQHAFRTCSGDMCRKSRTMSKRPAGSQMSASNLSTVNIVMAEKSSAKENKHDRAVC